MLVIEEDQHKKVVQQHSSKLSKPVQETKPTANADIEDFAAISSPSGLSNVVYSLRVPDQNKTESQHSIIPTEKSIHTEFKSEIQVKEAHNEAHD